MRFGEFTVDLAAGEVHRNGTKVRLQELPFRVLAELASRPGEVVTREELRARLWDASTFVDAEAGLNTAVAKLREALGDSADAPRFVETIPKRGYRFIARVETAPEVPGPSSRVPGPQRYLATMFLVLGTLTIVATVVAVVVMARAQATKTTIAVVLFHNETGQPEFDRLAQQLTDATVVALAANSKYAVIGNAPVLRTPRIFEDLKKVGNELQAEYVLIAQVQNPAAGLTVRLHFIRTSDLKHLWAKSTAGAPDVLESLVVETARKGIAEALGK